MCGAACACLSAAAFSAATAEPQVTLFGKGVDVHLSAITAGGSTAMFFKLNTFGEEAFLEKLKELL